MIEVAVRPGGEVASSLRADTVLPPLEHMFQHDFQHNPAHHPMSDKVRENRLRRMAERQGLTLVKSRRRDPRAYDFGGYMLCDAATSLVVIGSSPLAFGLDLDDVEAFLTDPERHK